MENCRISDLLPNRRSSRGPALRRGCPERHIQLQIIKYLKARGMVCGKIKTMGARKGKAFIFDVYQFRGLPDLLAFCPDLYFIEVKAPGNKQTPEQKDFQRFCINAGINYLLVYSLEEIIAKIFPQD